MLSAKTLLLTNMNRSELQDKFIANILADMDVKTMMQTAYYYINDCYDKLSSEELQKEVKEHYPELLPHPLED